MVTNQGNQQETLLESDLRESLLFDTGQFLRMTRSIIATAAADFGSLYLKNDHELRILSTGRRRGLDIDIELFRSGSQPSESNRPWLKEVVERVSRAREKLVLPSKSDDGMSDVARLFPKNSGLTFLCLPIQSDSLLHGVVYLERTPEHAIFEPEQEGLELLVAQIADYIALHTTLLAERNLLRTVVDAIPDLVFIKDTFGRFVVSNKALVKAFGLERAEELIGKSDFDFFPAEEVRHIYDDEQLIIRSGQAHINLEEFNSTLGGIDRWFSTTKVPLFSAGGKVIGLVGACREITEHKLHELEIEKRNSELEVLNAKLTQTKDQLVRSEKMAALGSLVAGIAHELNTPIGIGVTAASTLHDQTKLLMRTIEEGELRRSVLNQYLTNAATGAELMLSALDTANQLVLSFKQIAVDRASSRRQTFDLRLSLDDTIAMLAPLYKNTQIVFELDMTDGIELNSFPGALSEVVTNLVSNALVHAFNGRSSGVIRLTVNRLKPDQLLLLFSDNGVGMSPETLARVFEPFFTTRLGLGGSGLGMHIVYNIVTDLLGGDIRLESELRCGTTVIIQLPLRAPDVVNAAGRGVS